MDITDYKLTLRGKDGGMLATTHHHDKAAAFASLNHLAAQMHTRPEARNTGVFDTEASGWLWDTDVREACIAGTYTIKGTPMERVGGSD